MGSGGAALPCAARPSKDGRGRRQQPLGAVRFEVDHGHPGLVVVAPEQIAADPDAQRLLALCGRDQRPVIPVLAWEYGGSDHQWINPEKGSLVYCVHTPVRNPTPNWQYDARNDQVTAAVYVLFPDQNPCKDQQGANQVMACIGHRSNFEILVDTASINDGRDVGLSLASASTALKLILPDGSRVHLWDDA